MLFSLYPEITQNYFILCFFACLGVLQWTAARHERLTLSLLGPWGLGWSGRALGLGMAVAAFAWFFQATPGLFITGLAGGELSTLFTAGAGCALLVARLAGLLWQAAGQRKLSPRLVKQRGRNRA